MQESVLSSKSQITNLDGNDLHVLGFPDEESETVSDGGDGWFVGVVAHLDLDLDIWVPFCYGIEETG